MLWKNLIILAVLAYVTTAFAGNKIATETMDDALGHKIDYAVKKVQKRGVANDTTSRKLEAEEQSINANEDLQYWNVQEEVEQTAEQLEPTPEDEAEY